MQAAEKILNSDGCFVCERFRVRMPKRDCVRRRNRAIEQAIGCHLNLGAILNLDDEGVSVVACLDCEQGEGIYRDVLRKLKDCRRKRKVKTQKSRPNFKRKGRPGIVYLELGMRLKATREAMGLSQNEIARIMGVDQTIISNMEHNKRMSRKTAERVERGLGGLNI